MTDTELLFLKGLTVYLLLINFTAIIATLSDKLRAKKNLWRISEKCLFTFGILGGAAGEYITMLLIRHKTKHKKFMILLPLFITVHIALLIWIVLQLL